MRSTIRSALGYAVPVSAVLAASLIVAACGPGSAPVTMPPVASVSPEPPTMSPAPAALPDDELRKALHFRRTFGLRADEAWALEVAANPASAIGRTELGVPLLPWEYEELIRRTANAENFAPIVRTYGASQPDTWGGMYIDQQAGGVLVAAFSGDLEAHRQRLALLLPDVADVEVRGVNWSVNELRGFVRTVNAEASWFPTIGASLFTVDIDEINNQVWVHFQSQSSDDAERIAAHFGHPDWLGSRWMAPEWTGPRGDLLIRVEDKRGRPLEGLECYISVDDPVAHEGEGLITSDARGRCRAKNYAASDYTIEIWKPAGDLYETVATGHAQVLPDRTVTVVIVVEEDR